jgi:hypothetical protein
VSTRFGSVITGLPREGSTCQYMRICSPMLCATVKGLFDQIVVIPCADGASNLIILTGYKGDSNNLYTEVSMALQAMNQPEEVTELWLPQFKCQQSVTTDALCGLTPCSTNYCQEATLELFTMPKSDGTPEMRPSADAIVLD